MFRNPPRAWLALAAVLPGLAMANPDRELLWGDTHLHTNNSFDAFLNGNMTADPDVAFRWAKGLPVIHPYNRTRVRIGTPLDFLVVSDHAEFMGGIKDVYYDGVQAEDPGPIDRLLYWFGEWRIRSAIDDGTGADFFRDQLPVGDKPPVEAAATWQDDIGTDLPPGAEVSRRNAWQRFAETADRHNQPGEFTALIGWEWSSNPGGANLHRVVVSDADAGRASQFIPFGSTDSPYPEDLWAFLDRTGEQTGTRFLAIPHNSNISKGLMFSEDTLRGVPMDAAYAETRARLEPVVEITQIKGDSETHPEFAPDDDFADYEPYGHYIQQIEGAYEPRPGDYVREALKTGLALEAELGVNPFEFGVIGSTDAHTGLSSAEEPNFWGKMAWDSVPEHKAGDALTRGATGWDMAAAGLAAVWADENTRGGILDAFARREVYATTGPRIRLRVFGGWDFTADDLEAADWVAEGYRRGVPMGATLPAPPAGADAAPTLMIMASADPRSGHLDRVQVVKGWLDGDGTPRERIFDVVWSGDRQPGLGGLPAVGDTVDRATATYTNDIGAPTLSAVWRDPDYRPGQSAFYYVRVLEIPTPRHSLMDAIALGYDTAGGFPDVIQERAYSSAIWARPAEPAGPR